MQTLGDVWMKEAEERKQRQAAWTNESSRQCPVHQSADVCGTAVCRPRKPLARVRRKATEHSQMFVGTIEGKPLGLFTLELRPPKYLQDSSSVLKGRADSQLTPLWESEISGRAPVPIAGTCNFGIQVTVKRWIRQPATSVIYLYLFYLSFFVGEESAVALSNGVKSLTIWKRKSEWHPRMHVIEYQ